MSQTYFFILSFDMPSSFFIESLDMLSFDMVSFFIESFDMLSLDIVVFAHGVGLAHVVLGRVWAKAAGAPASESDMRPADRAIMMRERVIARSS